MVEFLVEFVRDKEFCEVVEYIAPDELLSISPYAKPQ